MAAELQTTKTTSEDVLTVLYQAQKAAYTKPGSIELTTAAIDFKAGKIDAETVYALLSRVGYTPDEILTFANSLLGK